MIFNNCLGMQRKMFTTFTDTDMNNCFSLDHTKMFVQKLQCIITCNDHFFT